jgi:tetratricopeptide (TPR) repeat protein
MPLDALIRRTAPYYVLALAVFVAYGNVYGNQFLFDDNLLIQLNSYLRDWSTFPHLFTASTTEGAHIQGGFYRPLQNILFFIAFQLGGEHPFWFHVLNVALHIANACLVFTLGRRLNFTPLPAFLASLLWALHPLHTEAVTYMSGTADPLYVFFCLTALCMLIPTFSPQRIKWSIPFFMLALASKETAVMFPLLVVVCMFMASPDRLNFRTYWRTWPLWLVTALYLAWRLTANKFAGPNNYEQLYVLSGNQNLKLYADHIDYRLYTFLATLPDYARLLIWPSDLHMERKFDLYIQPFLWPVVIGFGIAALVLGQIMWGKGRRGLPLSFGLLWCAASYAPNTGILMPVNSFILEHWMYLPSAGLFLGLGQTLHNALARRPKAFQTAAIGLCLILAVIEGILTFAQNEIWRDPFTFYSHIFKYGDATSRCHNNLAMAYAEQNDYPNAIAEFQKAIALGDTYAEVHYNLALTLLKLPDQQSHMNEIVAHLERAIAIDPNFFRSYLILSQIYRQNGNSDKAADYAAKARQLMSPNTLPPQ